MTWVIVDANNVMARNFFGISPMNHKGRRTEAIYGLFRDLAKVVNVYGTDRFVLCFDHGRSKRYDMYPRYKHSRVQSKLFIEQVNASKKWSFLEEQVEWLKGKLTEALPDQTLMKSGYEADDLAASASGDCRTKNPGVIVSTDKDFYQCLRPCVSIHNPRTGLNYTHDQFVEEWGVYPKDWPTVKALAGCDSDDIVGVPGVGEKTAAKYVGGEAKKGRTMPHKTKAAIAAFVATDRYLLNYKLTKLPLAGLPVCPLIKPPKGWRKVLTEVLSEAGIGSVKF